MDALTKRRITFPRIVSAPARRGEGSTRHEEEEDSRRNSVHHAGRRCVLELKNTEIGRASEATHSRHAAASAVCLPTAIPFTPHLMYTDFARPWRAPPAVLRTHVGPVLDEHAADAILAYPLREASAGALHARRASCGCEDSPPAAAIMRAVRLS